MPMIVEYQHDPNKPDGDGRLFREVTDGTPFTFYTSSGLPPRQKSITCIATNMFEVHTGSTKPYDRRLGIELATGFYYWLTPETRVVTSPLKVVLK
jgi:hypothetical protein